MELSESRYFQRTVGRSQIKKAADQLGEHLKYEGNPRDCGIIAISVTRAFTTGKQFLQVSAHTQVSDYLDGELQKLAIEHKKAWLGIKSPKISGLIFHLSVPGYVSHEKLIITATQRLIIHIDGKSDLSLLRELARLLQTKVSV